MTTNIKFPKHDCELILNHNQCRSYYETVAQYVAEDEGRPENQQYLEWVSPEQRQKAIDTNEIWVLQWYPNTPIGFNVLAACDLNVLLKAAVDES